MKTTKLCNLYFFLNSANKNSFHSFYVKKEPCHVYSFTLWKTLVYNNRTDMKKNNPTTFLYKAKAIFSMAVIQEQYLKIQNQLWTWVMDWSQFYNSSGRKINLVTLVLKLAKLETRNVRSNKSNSVLIWSE